MTKEELNPSGASFGGVSLMLGIISIPAFYFPLVGIVLGIFGINFSLKGLRKSQNWSRAGLICSIIGLVLSLANSFLGAYLGATGQLDSIVSLLSSL